MQFTLSSCLALSVGPLLLCHLCLRVLKSPVSVLPLPAAYWLLLLYPPPLPSPLLPPTPPPQARYDFSLLSLLNFATPACQTVLGTTQRPNTRLFFLWGLESLDLILTVKTLSSVHFNSYFFNCIPDSAGHCCPLIFSFCCCLSCLDTFTL